MMSARIMLVLAAGLGWGTGGVTAGVDPVLRLTNAQQSLPDGTEPFDHYSDILNTGVVFGSINEAYLTEYELIRVEPDGSIQSLAFTGVPTGGVWNITGDGAWGIGSAGFTYEPGECSLDFGGSTGRYLRVDLHAGIASYLTSLCPNFDALGISAADGSVVGRLLRNDWPSSYVDGEMVQTVGDAAIWRDGTIVVLQVPEFSGAPSVDPGSIARAVSADGGVIVGDATTHVLDETAIPFGEAIRWTDGVPEVLPHFPSADAEAQTSFGLGLSADGSVVYGRTTDWAFDGVHWDWTDQTSWIMRNGKMTDLRVPNQNHALYGITGDGSLLYGAEFTSRVADWRGKVWSEVNGIESADAWLARLGVDLGAQIVRQVVDVSDNGAWMLVTLRVDDEHEQYARIAIPCSAADVTADRAITPDDAAAYAERFLSGNPLADLSADGALDLVDLARFVSLYAAGCDG